MPPHASLPRTPTVERLDARLRGPGSVALIEAEELAALERETGLDERGLVLSCLDWAQRWALAPLSKFEVGAAALGQSGRLYLGGNIEFSGLPLSQTIHAEQSVIAHAWAHEERGLKLLATSAAPCGFCRQFMLELPEPRPLLLLADLGPMTLAELLPSAFGPTQLGRAPQLLRAGPHSLSFIGEGPPPDSLPHLARSAAQRGNAPYTGALSGVALETEDGQRFCGAVAESAAYNPTLAPMQAALITAHHGGALLESIVEAALVELVQGQGESEAPLSQRELAWQVLGAAAPHASLNYELLRRA